MGSVNTRVVRRSNSLLAEDGKAYGPNFIYNEFGSSKSFSYCIIFLIVIVLLFLSAVIPCTRFILRKFVPQPGEGPSEKERAKNVFRTTHIAQTTPLPSAKPIKVVGIVSGGDPGYTETAKMLCESGLTLALQRQSLPRHGGVLTPSAAFGSILVENLSKAGLTFRINE